MDFNNDIIVEYFNDVTDDIKYIRETVFVIEQGFTEEFDEIDKKSIHLLVKVNNKRAATARIFKSDNSSKKWTVGRFAVLEEYRGKGLGSFLMKKVEEKIKEQGGNAADIPLWEIFIMTSMLHIFIWRKSCKKCFIKNYVCDILKNHYKINDYMRQFNEFVFNNFINNAYSNFSSIDSVFYKS